MAAQTENETGKTDITCCWHGSYIGLRKSLLLSGNLCSFSPFLLTANISEDYLNILGKKIRVNT
jgi:hypothetical protein